MNSVMSVQYTASQIAIWLRGLLTIAWADGNFDSSEQDIIEALLLPEHPLLRTPLEPVSPAELATELGSTSDLTEDFLRTAVMVALADGVYSASEDRLLQQFCTALGYPVAVLDTLRPTSCEVAEQRAHPAASPLRPPAHPKADVLQPVRDWLDGLEIKDPRVAHFLCQLIPGQCPFERDVVLFGRQIVHIPPLCKLNPLYEQLAGIRFRALCYLADTCGEDVSPYC
ncbi:Mo-dependent nitrogenase C-terminal domain-containing protein [Anthocerotibacter panamensis]|uniref:Mo-dependent nitrogenase C-terminal domain-containing protein n=1 Tax=Anthocerotibacter panamensis TaxID=2857077 RepID=UPI001FD93C72|nr:Mo-dependent nitrogenase C-terminal domain-containing protein [Anthocerotibacter panamensis]